MNSKHFLVVVMVIAVALLGAVSVSAQIAELRGKVVIAHADGTTVPLQGATIDVFRTDISGNWSTTTDKHGEYVFAGLPYVGTYLVAVSAPNAQPEAKGGVKAGRGDLPLVTLIPGEGKRLTLEEAKARAAEGSQGGGNTAADNAKRAEAIKRNAAIEEEKKKVTDINAVYEQSIKNGNEQLHAGHFDEAIATYDQALTADPAHPGAPILTTNKSIALRQRGTARYNATITSDQYKAALKSGDSSAIAGLLEPAKKDWTDAAANATRAVELLKSQTAADASPQATSNKYFAFLARAQAMNLFVSKVDASKVDDGVAAYQDYMAAETDAIKKSKAQFDLAHMLMDAGAADKAFAEFKKILADKPDDPDANLGAGLALYGTGDKLKYQEAANYLQRFVDNAPDTNKDKADIKMVLAELKNTENVVPEKTTRPPRKRP